LDISLYFHIPFCTKKCPYCHFYVVPNRPIFHDILQEGLALEWERQKKLLRGHRIVSLYFGGGTPTLMHRDEIETILKLCTPLPDCEITIEANPENSSLDYFQALKKMGITRMSFGVQSLDDRSLTILGRSHSAKEAKNAIGMARLAGIENISIDLMYDLPEQDEDSWSYTLDQIQDLPIQHISLYNLTIEPHTSFYKRKLRLPRPDTSLRLLSKAIKTFEALGFERYEISAFAKPGFRSKHNLGYWMFRPFLGFGPSAFSYWHGERFQNTPNIQRYLKALREDKSPVHFRETLSFPHNLKEQIAVGLRLSSGCMIPEKTPQETRDTLTMLQEKGFLAQNDQIVQLTEKGKLFYDTVAAEIV